MSSKFSYDERTVSLSASNTSTSVLQKLLRLPSTDFSLIDIDGNKFLPIDGQFSNLVAGQTYKAQLTIAPEELSHEEAISSANGFVKTDGPGLEALLPTSEFEKEKRALFQKMTASFNYEEFYIGPKLANSDLLKTVEESIRSLRVEEQQLNSKKSEIMLAIEQRLRAKLDAQKVIELDIEKAEELRSFASDNDPFCNINLQAMPWPWQSWNKPRSRTGRTNSQVNTLYIEDLKDKLEVLKKEISDIEKEKRPVNESFTVDLEQLKRVQDSLYLTLPYFHHLTKSWEKLKFFFVDAETVFLSQLKPAFEKLIADFNSPQFEESIKHELTSIMQAMDACFNLYTLSIITEEIHRRITLPILTESSAALVDRNNQKTGTSLDAAESRVRAVVDELVASREKQLDDEISQVFFCRMVSTFEYGGKEHKLQTARVIPRVLSKLFRLEEGRIVLIKGREIFKQEDGRFQPLADGRYTLTIGDSVNTDHADPYIVNESEEEQKQEAAVQNHENSCRDLETFERSVTTTPVVDVDENEAHFRELKTKHPFLHALATTSVILKLLCCVAKSAPDISLFPQFRS